MPHDSRNSLLPGHSLTRSLTGLAAPMLIGALLQNLQSVIDMFWVGRLGPVAVGAVAVSGTILMILFPMLMGVSVGTVALVARFIGAGDLEKANAAAGQSLTLSVLLGAASGAVGWAFTLPLFELLGTPPEIAAAGEPFLRISLLGSATVFFLFQANAALQGAGDAWTPMWIMLISNVLNIVLEPLFIFGLGPLPPMGVRGAALATVLAQALAALLSMHALSAGRSRLHVTSRQWRPDWNLCWRILRIGIPGSGQMFTRSLMSAVMMRIVAGFGTMAVAAYGIGMRLHMLILMPAFAFGGAAATLVGQNLGANRPAVAARAAWLATGLDALIMLAAAGVMLTVPEPVIRFFNADPEVVRLGADYLRIVSPFYLFAALGIVLGRGLNGAGDSLAPMIVTILSLWGAQVPLALWFSRIWNPPINGVWWAMGVAILLHGLLITAWFSTGRWKHQKV